ncbi:hypothetical protein Q7C36_001589 [Tachysurus vachellii]|uniref:Uncharacterized protein n=1 Tax=Tachysurus vachellii TaxID=175792 RepID=A0AA88T6K2_TACVA|nr:hypothetical protein Q7C36_001589 [Tachysurus vachellii]
MMNMEDTSEDMENSEDTENMKDMGDMEDTEHMEDSKDIKDTEIMEDTENMKDMGDMEDTEHMEDTGRMDLCCPHGYMPAPALKRLSVEQHRSLEELLEDQSLAEQPREPATCHSA